MKVKQNDQTHSFNAEFVVWSGDNQNYGRKFTVENIDNCCQDHAESEARHLARLISTDLEYVWKQKYQYEIKSVTQNW